MITALGERLLRAWIYVMVKVGADFVVPFTERALARIEADGDYPPEFGPFLQRVLVSLAEGEWPPGSYFPGGWFRVLPQQGYDPATVRITPQSLAAFTLDEVRVDPQGRWFVGRKRIEGRVLDHFLRHLGFDLELQRYVIRYRLERHFETRYLHHESPPFRVRRVERKGGNAELWLNDGSREPLAASTLVLDRRERLYCAVKPQRLPAQFDDTARWTLLKDATQRDEHLLLFMDGQVVELPVGGNWLYADRLPE